MQRRSHHALAVAALCVVWLVWVWHIAFNTDGGRWLDGAVLQGFTGLRTEKSVPLADALTHLADPRPFMLLTGLLVLVALLRRRFGAAAVVAVVLPAANFATQVLKPALAEPRPHEYLGDGQIAAAAWPSGHSTAAMTLALGLVMVSAPRWRPLAAAVGGTLAFLIVSSIELLGWHYPSDILGGFGIAALGFSLGLAVLWTVREGAGSEDVAPQRPVLPALAPTLVAGIALAAAAGALALTRLDSAVAYAQAHTSFVLGLATFAVLALALAGGFAAALFRRS